TGLAATGLAEKGRRLAQLRASGEVWLRVEPSPTAAARVRRGGRALGVARWPARRRRVDLARGPTVPAPFVLRASVRRVRSSRRPGLTSAAFPGPWGRLGSTAEVAIAPACPRPPYLSRATGGQRPWRVWVEP